MDNKPLKIKDNVTDTDITDIEMAIIDEKKIIQYTDENFMNRLINTV